RPSARCSPTCPGSRRARSGRSTRCCRSAASGPSRTRSGRPSRRPRRRWPRRWAGASGSSSSAWRPCCGPAGPEETLVMRDFEETYREQRARFPGAAPGWQPVHTVYVPADRFTAGTVAAWGDEALSLAKAHLAGPAELAEVFGVPADLAGDVHERVLRKLAAEPVEDLRVDFEDGYGVRTGDEEDRDVEQAAAALAAMHAAGALPRRWGLPVKSFADGDPARSVRTLGRLVTGLAARVGGLPDGFTVTL